MGSPGSLRSLSFYVTGFKCFIENLCLIFFLFVLNNDLYRMVTLHMSPHSTLQSLNYVKLMC